MIVVNAYVRSATFNPLTDWTTDPIHGVWASDPLWTPPADGGAVSSWRNGGSVGTPNVTQGTAAAQPTYDASNPAFNGAPTVSFDGVDDVLAMDPTDIPQPYWIVVVAKTNVVETTAIVGPGSVSGYRLGTSTTTGVAWRWVPTTGIQGGTTDTNPHLLIGAANGASGVLSVDGTVVATGAVGSTDLTTLSLGAGNAGISSFSLWLDGDIAYAAVFTTDPTGQAEWAAFKAWVTSFYGITVA